MLEDNSMTTPVTIELDRKGIPYKFFAHPGQLQSLEQAARERGQLLEQVIRSILFRLSEDEFVMVLVAGPKQISWTKLRNYLGQSRMTMASEKEVIRMTGYPLGAVSPFGLEKPIRIIIDKRVLKQSEVSIGSGVRHTTVIMKKEDLINALGDIEVGDFLEETN